MYDTSKLQRETLDISGNARGPGDVKEAFAGNDLHLGTS